MENRWDNRLNRLPSFPILRNVLIDPIWVRLMEGLLSRYYMRRDLQPDGFAKGLDMVKKKGEEPETVDFEGSLQELETIVRRLEQGGGPLEQALGDYAQAIILLKSCHGRLEQAERKIEILSGVDANGTPVVRQVDDEELSLEDKQESRGQRRAVPRGQTPSSSGPRGKHSANTDDEGSLF